ncbi:MAG TPA: hypothetical protein VMU79_15985 [Casimicrobiaceae bacterium]|jgi:hypothetical protein|nr:hypothetical protein [Casimicrobiaceae bacterium]
MSIAKTSVAVAVAMLFAGAAVAQTTGSTVQRDVNQQNRIEQGLQSGELTTHEAGQLERQEATLEKMQSNALKDGSLSPAEKARLQRAQNKVSSDVYRDKHNAALGNPNSASSKRMQADVQRNANQQARIEQGVQSGALTNRETASLERGQSHVNRAEGRAAADGHVGPAEQANIQARENHQSKRIYRKKHNEAEKS